VISNNGRRPRTARLGIRFGPVEVAKPKSNCHAATLPESVELWALEAREVPETVPPREEPAEMVFEKEALAFMEQFVGELEGKTLKQKCPHEAKTLAWGSWIVERLGGWKGYPRSNPPGRSRWDAAWNAYRAS